MRQSSGRDLEDGSGAHAGRGGGTRSELNTKTPHMEWRLLGPISFLRGAAMLGQGGGRRPESLCGCAGGWGSQSLGEK